MGKIVYNACHGEFGLSEEAVSAYANRKGWTLYPERGRHGTTTYWLVPESGRDGVLTDDEFHRAPLEARLASNCRHKELVFTPRDVDRDDPDLVAIVETLGEKANGRFADLRVAEVAAGQRYRIDEYDGAETVMTVDDYEWKVAS